MALGAIVPRTEPVVKFGAGRIVSGEKAMKQMKLGKIAIATATFVCTALLSFGWSAEQRGVSLSIESAQARVGRPLTPVSVAGVARRQYRRAGYGYGAGVVGAGLAAGAIGATAVAAATSPWGYYGGYGGGGGYYAGSTWGDYECHPSHTYVCQPYAAKWGHPLVY
jgi:hypothetical protein